MKLNIPLLFMSLVMSILASGSDVYPVQASGIVPAFTSSPAIWAGEFLYLSGQTSPIKGADATIEIQNCFQQLNSVLKASGIDRTHIVYVQVYLTDPMNEPAFQEVWTRTFSKSLPARSLIYVSALDQKARITLSAVAIRDPRKIKAYTHPEFDRKHIAAAVQAEGMFYLSGFSGTNTAQALTPEQQVRKALQKMESILKMAGLDLRHMVFMNPYLTKRMPMNSMNRIYAEHFEFGNTPARATIQVSDLSEHADIEFTGVAVTNISTRKAIRPRNMPPSPTASPCVLAGNTLFCSAKSGFIPGINGGIYAHSVQDQLRQTMRNLLDGLEEADMDFSNVVFSNIYLDAYSELPKLDTIYQRYFKSIYPAGTAVQQIPPQPRNPNAQQQWPTLEQISIIAVK